MGMYEADWVCESPYFVLSPGDLSKCGQPGIISENRGLARILGRNICLKRTHKRYWYDAEVQAGY
jgi:hypothetical protein